MEKRSGSTWNRYKEPPEQLNEMHAHEGQCRYCKNVVKMYRDSVTYKLKPKECQCILCGQYYYMDIPDLDAWEKEQWQQKTSMRT
jgi:hypothetical protein